MFEPKVNRNRSVVSKNTRLFEYSSNCIDNVVEFADKLKISRGNIGAYEVGKNAPSDAVISLICKTFRVNEDWLRNGGDNEKMFIELSPMQEVGYYVEDLLEYDGNGNAFYDAIIEMMKTYHSLDDKSKTVIREYFKNVADGIKNKEEKA